MFLCFLHLHFNRLLTHEIVVAEHNDYASDYSGGEHVFYDCRDADDYQAEAT